MDLGPGFPSASGQEQASLVAGPKRPGARTRARGTRGLEAVGFGTSFLIQSLSKGDRAGRGRGYCGWDEELA